MAAAKKGKEEKVRYSDKELAEFKKIILDKNVFRHEKTIMNATLANVVLHAGKKLIFSLKLLNDKYRCPFGRFTHSSSLR